VWTHHPLVADGWSFVGLLREVANAYVAHMVAALAPFDPKPPHIRRVWRDLPLRELRSFSRFMLFLFALWLVFSPRGGRRSAAGQVGRGLIIGEVALDGRGGAIAVVV
jgi:hypothetical protein